MKVYIGGVEDSRLQVNYVRASYVAPWEAELFWPGRHDAPLGIGLWDEVRIEEENGTVRFRGDVAELRPHGIAREGTTLVARGRRFRLDNEPVRINGRSFYVWNRRGHSCSEGKGGEDSPGRDGGKWTCGEIAVDILEHALGVPAAGSAIPGHHGDPCCVTDTYLTAGDVAGYEAADWLARDSVLGEFSVDNTPVARAIDMLLGYNGGFFGWYIDPGTGRLVLVDMDALPVTDIEAGQFGRWQDAEGTDYRLVDNRLEWSLDGVCSTVVVQGADRTVEEMPADIEGTGNPGKGDLGELELVASPWKDYPAAYRAVCQPKRHPCAKPIDEDGNYTPPEGFASMGCTPRVYRGADGGPKYLYLPYRRFPTWMLASGIIGFHEVPDLEPGEKLWGWYWARMPFTVSAGPDGDAYHCYGYRRTRTVYDPAFRHPTTYPQAGTLDDESAMEVLAHRLLRLYSDVRRQGRLVCDEVDFGKFGLEGRYSVRNLGAEAGWTTPAPPPCTQDPTCWEDLRINAVEVTWNLEEDVTELRVANTFFMLEEYSELKRRLEMNLFARRELNLSEELLSCQSREPAVQEPSTTIGPTTESPTTTSAPTTEPPPTTATATTSAPTTTEEPTTAEPTTTTEQPTTTTTAKPTTSTTPRPLTTTTTTTAAPTTSTTPTPICPADCSTCNDTYTLSPDQQGQYCTGEDVTITRGDGCAWTGSDWMVNCETTGDHAGHWVAEFGTYCAYVGPEAYGDGSCPTGSYTVYEDNCSADVPCSNTLTIA